MLVQLLLILGTSIKTIYIGNTYAMGIQTRYIGIGIACIRNIFTKNAFIRGVKPRVLAELEEILAS